jgi:carbonic anhydrase
LYPKFCAGLNQSPIDIKTNLTVKTGFQSFVFKNYDNITLGSLLENGHTGKFLLKHSSVKSLLKFGVNI